MKILEVRKAEISAKFELTESEIELLVDLLDRKVTDSYTEMFKITEEERHVLLVISAVLREARSAVRSLK